MALWVILTVSHAMPCFYFIYIPEKELVIFNSVNFINKINKILAKAKFHIPFMHRVDKTLP